MVWEGKQSVVTGRKIVGATNPLQSEPGTVRGDFCIDVGRNLIHGAPADFALLLLLFAPELKQFPICCIS